jgi:hypothetical protein
LLSARKIAAGANGRVEARIDTHGFSGPIEKMITLTTNDPQHSNVVLSVKATVQPEIEFSETSIFFGNVTAGKGAERQVLLTIRPEKRVRILSVLSKEPAFAVKLEEIPDNGSLKYRLITRVSADAKPGYHMGQIIVKTSSRLTREIAMYQTAYVSASGR